MYALPASQPGQLAFGQLPGSDNATLDHLVPGVLAVQITPDLSVTYGTHGRQLGMQVSSSPKGFDLLDQAVFNHLHETLFNTPMQDLPLSRRNGHLRDSIRQDTSVWRAASGFLQPLSGAVFCHAQPADSVDLQRPDKALRIVGMNPCS